MTDPSDQSFLADSSAWIPYLRRPHLATPLHARMRALIAADSLATTGVVRVELLAGARDRADYARITYVLDGCHQLATDPVLEAAGQLGFHLRRRGIVAQTTDLIISAVAIRADAVLLHRDADFDLIAQHSALKVESYL